MNCSKESHPPAATSRSLIRASAALEWRSSSGDSDGRIECAADAVIIALDVNESERRTDRQSCADHRCCTPGGGHHRTQAACGGGEYRSALSELRGSVFCAGG